MTLIPTRFLFDFEFPLRYRGAAPKIDGDVSDWSDADLLPRLGELDGQQEFAPVWACWNEQGLYVACEVTGKRKRLRCEPGSYWAGDNLRLCIDTRPARDVRRATRFCRQVYLLPAGGEAKKDKPVAGSGKFRMAREDAPSVAPGRIEVASRILKGGYALEAHIPADCLPGFDPAEHPRLGLYYILEDDDFGQQYLTIGDDLNWYIDPSTWATAVLTR